jgi:hypothetical protein
MSALLTFLGGSAFRMIWGELSGFLTKRQEFSQEIQMIEAQRQADAEAHTRNMQMMQLQKQLGIEEVRVGGELAMEKVNAEAFVEAQKRAFSKTGIKFVDVWNGIIRPLFASLALMLWVLKVSQQDFVMDEWDRDLAAGVLGFFVADRTLGKRGK